MQLFYGSQEHIAQHNFVLIISYTEVQLPCSQNAAWKSRAMPFHIGYSTIAMSSYKILLNVTTQYSQYILTGLSWYILTSNNC